MDDRRDKLIAAWTSLIVGILLFIAKYYAFVRTGSQSVLSDALESIVNIVAAGLAVLVVSFASKPADADHPYGHGKAEFFSSAFEGGLIAFAAALILFEAVESLVVGVELKELDVGLMIVAGAGIINAILGAFLVRTGKKKGSPALEASGVHVLSDFWTSLGVVVALILVKMTGWIYFDPIAAVIVGVNLAWTGGKLVKKSLSGLMDAQDLAVIDALCGILERKAVPGMIRVHHTRVIRSGNYHHVDAHLVVPEFWSVEKAHDESDQFESEVMAEYGPEGEMHLHLDPCRRAYCTVCDLRDCPVRQKDFSQKLPMTRQELISPDEPPEFGGNQV